MTYKQIKWMILLLPTLITGLWEYVRHQFLLHLVSMEAGNVLTPVIVFAVSAVLLFPLFSRLERFQQELQAERAQKAAFEAQDQLARELHDGISQSLFLLAVKVDRLEYTTDRGKHEDEVQALRKTVHEVNRYVRQAISNLRYARNRETDKLLKETLEDRIRHLTAEALIPFQLEWHIPEERITPRERVELLACIREAVVNIQKHSGASAAQIEALETGNAGTGAGDELDHYAGNPGPANRADYCQKRGGRRRLKTRVLVVDDHAHAQEAICEILAADPQFEVIGVVTSGPAAIAYTEQWMPDLILMDIQMPEMDGLETTQIIKLRFPYVKIVMITVSDDMFHLLEALKRGAQGYLLKNLEPSTWLKYLNAIVQEEAPLSRELAFEILKDVSLSVKRESVEALTGREQEILGKVAEGLTNKEIADNLMISEHTVKNHLKNILQKLQMQNRVQLTRYAMELGLVNGSGGGKGKTKMRNKFNRL